MWLPRAAGLALLAAALCACPRQEPSHRVLLVGIDGATFRVADPLLRAGKLPNLAALIERGVRAPLLSDEPMYSPALWTTIATGKGRAKHGIESFTVVPPDAADPARDQVLVNGNFRRTAALWNMLTIAGRTVNFVGWWATWPAEAVAGTMVSDRTARDRFADWAADRARPGFRKVHPPEAEAEIGALVTPPQAIDFRELQALASFSEAERARLAGAQEAIPYDGLSVLKFAHQAQKSYARIGHYCLRQRPADLTAVLLVATDPVSHCFWHDYEPESFEGVDPEEAARLGGLIPRYYEYVDGLLGELLAAAGPETTVIVCSDHGFRASGLVAKPYEAQSGEHDLHGLFVAAGPAIRRGAEPREPRIFDIAPTLLAILGLPIARDFDGRVLREILAPDVLEDAPAPIESWDRLWRRAEPEAAAAGGADEAFLEELRVLGYLGAAGGPGSPAGPGAARRPEP